MKSVFQKFTQVLELQDRFSGPAAKMNAALTRLQSLLGGVVWKTRAVVPEAGRARDAMGRFLKGSGDDAKSAARSMGLLEKAVKEVGDALKSGATKSVVSSLASGIESGGRSLLEAGLSGAQMVLDSAQFRENTLISLRTILGTQEAAHRVFEESQRIAQMTPLDTRTVISQRSGLVQAGFSERMAGVVQAAAIDVGQAAGGGADGAARMQQFIHALSKLQGQRTLSGEMLEGIGGNRAHLFQAIARRMNITGNEAQIMQKVQRAISARRVNSDVALGAVFDTVQADVSHGRLGGLARAQSDSLTGLLSNLQSAPGDLLDSMDLANSSGISTLRGALKSILGLFDKNSDSGKRMMGIVDSLVNGVFGTLFRDLSDPATAGGAMDKILTTMEQLVPVVTSVVDGIKSFGEGAISGLMEALAPMMNGSQATGVEKNTAAWKQLGEVIGGAVGYMVRFADLIARILSSISQVSVGVTDKIFDLFHSGDGRQTTTRGVQMGQQIAAGVAQGMRDGQSTVAAAAVEMSDTAVSSASNRLQIESPSRVFARLGRYTAEGFGMGIEQGTDAVDKAVTNLVSSPRAPQAQGTPPSQQQAGISVTVNVNGDATDETVDKLRSTIRMELAALFGQSAMEVGA